MKLPKLRLTWGSIIALPPIIVGLVKEIAPDVIAISPALGAKLLSIGSIAALVSKGIASFNHHTIPEDKKAETAGVLFEKTGPFKP